MRFILKIICFFLYSFSHPSWASDEQVMVYAGFGGGYTKLPIKSYADLLLNEPVLHYQAPPFSAYLALGVDLNPELSAELNFQALSKSQIDIDLGRVQSIQVKHHILSIDVLKRLCLNDDIDLLGSLGIGWFWSETSPSIEFSRSLKSHVYAFAPRLGIGLDYNFSARETSTPIFLRTLIQFQKGNDSFRYALNLRTGLYCRF